MGGLSLMSVTVMMAVAVLERPKFRLPSMSVACTMMVYWDTFCKRQKQKKKKTQCAVICKGFSLYWVSTTATDWLPRGTESWVCVLFNSSCPLVFFETQIHKVEVFPSMRWSILSGTLSEVTPSESCTVTPPHGYSIKDTSYSVPLMDRCEDNDPTDTD